MTIKTLFCNNIHIAITPGPNSINISLHSLCFLLIIQPHKLVRHKLNDVPNDVYCLMTCSVKAELFVENLGLKTEAFFVFPIQNSNFGS